MAVRAEKISCTVSQEAPGWQAEETTETLAEKPEGFYGSCLSR